MAPLFSDKMYDTLLQLDDATREGAVAQLERRVRSTSLYEALSLAFGAIGAHRLYLGDWRGFVSRLAVVIVAGALLCVGLWRGEAQPLQLAGAVAVAQVGLWAWDYFSRKGTLSRYHARLEDEVLASLVQTNTLAR